MVKESRNYVAVRKSGDDGSEWFDISSLSVLLVDTIIKVSEMDERLPTWSKFNPVTRYTTVVLKEV